MPDQPTPALLAAARAYALSVWTYDPDVYRSAEHRDKHIHVDAVSVARAPWFAALWNAGIAEGRRQAAEGPVTFSVAADLTDDEAAELKARFQQAMQRPAVMTVLPEPVEIRQREWAVRYPDGYVYDDVTEAAARDIATRYPHRVVVSRLVGPWEPDEQPEPLADDPVARRLGLVDAEGRTLCRCLAGSSDCPHRPASGGVVEPSGPLTAEEAEPDPLPPVLLPDPDASQDVCPKSQRVDGPYHSTRWDGDDARTVCVFCGEVRDAISGKVVKPAPARRQHDPGALIEKPLELTTERGHLIETTTYDAALHPIAARIEPKPGVQFGNGHRTDCRCPACRPDILRWPHAPEPDLYEQGGHLDGEFAAERGKFDPLIGEQGEGGTR